jgi:hypothetical protein
MNSKKVAETIQQTREWARGEYETKTKGLIFTKDFQSRQEAVMGDRLATIGERVMAWILRRSWGEYVLYAIKDDGQPAFQVDCARELRVDKRRVAAAVDYYKSRGYLEVRGKLLYPVISPVLASPPPNDKKSGEYRTFLEQWKVAHSADFEELKVARSTVKRITKVLLSDYKKSRHPVESGAVSLLETDREKSETGPSSSSAVSVLPARPEKAEDEDGSSYREFKKAYPATHFDEPKAKPSFEKKTKAEQTRILERLQIYLPCERWQDGGGRWIPLASTWLQSYDADPPPLVKRQEAKSKRRSVFEAFMEGD